MRKSSAKKAGFRSNFELGIARSLKKREVPYEYENIKLTYVPKPRTYTPDFYLPDQKMFIEVKVLCSTQADHAHVIHILMLQGGDPLSVDVHRY